MPVASFHLSSSILPASGPSKSPRPAQAAAAATAKADATAFAPPANYYAAAQGKQGADLLDALGQITQRGHRDVGYAQARDGMFGIVHDLDGDNRVPELYTGLERGNIDGRKSAYQRGMNAEHTWPQSLGAEGIAKSDLHQLMPADINYNGRRGNFAYGIVANQEWSTPRGADADDVSRFGTDDTGRQVFEPRAEVRGDIARGLLYFYTRYNENRQGSFSLNNFKSELPHLLDWHKSDPVNDAERARNDAVQDVQGNRNPFIDHPEFIDQIGDFPVR